MHNCRHLTATFGEGLTPSNKQHFIQFRTHPGGSHMQQPGSIVPAKLILKCLCSRDSNWNPYREGVRNKCGPMTIHCNASHHNDLCGGAKWSTMWRRRSRPFGAAASVKYLRIFPPAFFLWVPLTSRGGGVASTYSPGFQNLRRTCHFGTRQPGD